MTWDFSTDPDFQQHLDWMNDFVRAEVWPLDTLDLSWPDLRRAIAPLRERVKARGLWAAHLGPEHGGQGFGQVKLGLMHEILGTSPFGPLVFGNQAPDSGNAEILARSGTAEQQRRWLAPLLAGDVYSSFAMTERDTAGADPTQLTTTAVRDGEDWVVNGRKWFISNAQIADFFIVTAVTDPHAPRHSKTSQLIIPAGTPGVTIVRALGSMEEPRPRDGGYPSHAEMTFTHARVPAGALLGEQGAGFTVAQQRLGPGRIHHCMRWLGQARRAFDMMCERSTYRSVQGNLLGEKGTVRDWIAESAAQMQAARLMTLHAAWIADTQGFAAARKEIAYIKFFGAAVLHDVLDRAVQVHGSLGYSTDLPLESMYRAARAARLYDGPDEVHRDSAARLILRDYAPPAGGVPSEHRPTRRRAARAQFAWLLDEAATGA
jgi:acyl-CoA dehydrogenase